jgi:phospholipase D1/2
VVPSRGRIRSSVRIMARFWYSHTHTLVVVVDDHRASIGGLDLYFGPWDSHNHPPEYKSYVPRLTPRSPLADVHPTAFVRTQDYNNARLLDFQYVDDYFIDQIDVFEAARMPWHDECDLAFL